MTQIAEIWTVWAVMTVVVILAAVKVGAVGIAAYVHAADPIEETHVELL